MVEKIKLLPEVVANQIAAGEVVGAPSSVVKEMMENAIDAGATHIVVNFREGGKELIQIIDNGCGMSPVDARLAFDRHATSKINTADDLYALHTFGFRGEALASIAAVAQVELQTRQSEDELGTLTVINGGEFVEQKAVMCEVGSQFKVRNLFFNTPARRRFMDKPTTLAIQIKSEFQKVALCNEGVHCELFTNDAPLYNLPPASLAARIVDVVGRHIKQNLLDVAADTSIVHLTGFVGRPAAAKKRNSEQYLFVNGRYFRSPYFTKAILKAYDKLIPEGCIPSYFLYLTIAPERIDVNVHPQKTEIKFADNEAVWQIINAAVRETLAKTGAVPMMDFDEQSAVDIPVMKQGAVYSEPRATSSPSYNPFSNDYIDSSAPDPNVDFTGFDVPYDGSMPSASVKSQPSFMPSSAVQSPMRSVGGEEQHSVATDYEVNDFADFASGAVAVNDLAEGDVEGDFDFIPSSSEQAEQQFMDICSSDTSTPQFESVISVGGGYAVALFGGRCVAVDLHRVKERIMYEYYLAMLGRGSAVSQQLLFPEQLTLSNDEYALAEENAVEFAALGFDVDFLGDGAIELKGTPSDIPADTIDSVVYALLQAFDSKSDVQQERREMIAKTMAVAARNALPKRITHEQAAELLSRLTECDNYNFSPSGKALMSELTSDELRIKLA